MSLPAWVGKGPGGPPITHEIADSFYTAPGYRCLGDDFYTCVMPVDRVADRSVIQWIRDFCPDAIPIWRKQRYMPPNSNEPIMVTHFGIASHVKDPKRSLYLAHVEMPVNADHPVPNQIEFILENRQDRCVLEEGGPGPYIPVDMRLYHYLREDFIAGRTAKEIAEMKVRKMREKKEREAAFHKAELEYRSRDWDRYVQKHLDAPGDTLQAYRQWRELVAWRKRRRQERMGTARPFVHIKGVS